MLRILLLLITIVAIIPAGLLSCSHQASDVSAASDTLLYIMAGQSNMAGRGAVEMIDTVANPRLLEMDAAQHYTLKQEPNALYQGALAGLDCGKSFGDELLLHLPSGTTVVLIQCAIGSSSIQDWLGDSLRTVHLYSNMLSRARAGLHSGQLKGVLWLQGEANAEYELASLNYDQYLMTFIRNFRRDIGMEQLPFFIGLLPSWCNKPYTATINNAIRRASGGLVAVYLIPTDDLSGKGDNLHFDAAGQRALGKRFAAAAAR